MLLRVKGDQAADAYFGIFAPQVVEAEVEEPLRRVVVDGHTVIGHHLGSLEPGGCLTLPEVEMWPSMELRPPGVDLDHFDHLVVVPRPS